MAKKKKNANYVTEKTAQKREAAAVAEKKAKNKKIAKTVITWVSVVVAIALAVVLIGLAFGLFEYYPTATEHVVIELEGYGSLHVELYGNDAPQTVAKFLSLAEDGYYNGRTLHTLLDDLIYGGNTVADSGVAGIIGEFSANGVNNRVRHERGVISMARGEGKDTAYGQFFIVTKDSPELDGNYAAFGMITDGMEIIDKILADAKPGADGVLPIGDQIVITSVSSHDSHGH